MTAPWRFVIENYRAEKCSATDLCVLANKNGIWLKGKGDCEAGLWTVEELSKVGGELRPLTVYLGTWEGIPCYGVDCPADFTADALSGARFWGLREAGVEFSADLTNLTLMAVELLNWRRGLRFCPACGCRLEVAVGERAMSCPSCGAMHYPRISPAVIVGITKGDEILLAHNAKFKEGLYGLIAGFVESGENLEQALVREVREEVGIEIKDIRYFGSQAWPYPMNLMLGFRAEYAGGELHPDGVEITDVGWFPRTAMPNYPTPGSIAHRIIVNWLETGERNDG